MFTGQYKNLLISLLIGLTMLVAACSQSPKSNEPTPIINMNVVVGALPVANTTYTGRTTIVQSGDNLYSISFVAGFDYRDVADWNSINDPEMKIFPGQVIKLHPPEGSESVGYQRSSEARAAETEEEYEPVQKAPEKVISTVPTVSSDSSEWIWPAQGDIIGKFSKAERRNGIEIAGNSGSPIKASAGGQVVYSGTGLIGYGRIIIVKHSPQFLSVYAHNSRVVVKEGDSVAKGQKIAEMGNTDANRVKLHFEIRRDGTPVDPLRYLPQG